MNPLISLLLIAAIGFVVIGVLALLASLAVLHFGKHYAQRQQEELKKQILALLPETPRDGVCREDFAEKLISEEVQVRDCPDLTPDQAEKLEAILQDYYQQQVQIRAAAENNQKKRPKRHRIRALLTEKREKGEW